MSEPAERPIKRRDFLGIAALGTFLAAIGASVGGMVSLVFPRAYPEPSQRYKIGMPGEYRVGEAITPTILTGGFIIISGVFVILDNRYGV